VLRPLIDYVSRFLLAILFPPLPSPLRGESGKVAREKEKREKYQDSTYVSHPLPALAIAVLETA